MLLTCCFREEKTKKGTKKGPISTTYPKGSIEDVVVIVPVPDNDNKKRSKVKLPGGKSKKFIQPHGLAIDQDNINALGNGRNNTEVIAELHLQEKSNKACATNNRNSVGSTGSEIQRSNSLASRQSSVQSNFKPSNGPNRDGSDRRDRKEKAPLQREKKRFYKQKSQDCSLQVTSASGTTSANASSIPYIDQSPTSYLPQNVSGVESKTDSMVNSKETTIGKQGKQFVLF